MVGAPTHKVVALCSMSRPKPLNDPLCFFTHQGDDEDELFKNILEQKVLYPKRLAQESIAVMRSVSLGRGVETFPLLRLSLPVTFVPGLSPLLAPAKEGLDAPGLLRLGCSRHP